MSVFHALSAGKIGHPAMLGPDFDRTDLGIVGLVVAMVTVAVTDVGVGLATDVPGSGLNAVVDAVEAALVDVVVATVEFGNVLPAGADAKGRGSVCPDPDIRPEQHETASDVTTTPATSVAH